MILKKDGGIISLETEVSSTCFLLIIPFGKSLTSGVRPNDGIKGNLLMVDSDGGAWEEINADDATGVDDDDEP